MAAEIHLGDVGTSFSITIKNEEEEIVNVSTATVKQIKFKKPDGTVLTKTASFVNDGSDGQIKYISQANDLDEEGLWKIQAYVEVGTTKFHSDISEFNVYPNLQ